MIKQAVERQRNDFARHVPLDAANGGIGFVVVRKSPLRGQQADAQDRSNPQPFRYS
jgi:hypothetical protein